MYDTVKGGDFLVDQNAAEIMSREAPENIFELEHMGCAFSRYDDGRIAQRNFGGHTEPRAVYAADRTGHALLTVLFEQLLKRGVHVYSEWYALDLVIKDDVAQGVVAYDILTGQIETISARAVMFATGGYGRAFRVSTNAFASTGDGVVMAYRAGVPLEDMEFVQFHPTGLQGSGILLSEAARGEGAHLVNSEGERFMERYAAARMELAPRDIIARAEQTEIDEGRGVTEAKDSVFMDLRPIGEERIRYALPSVMHLAQDFSGINALKEPVPIQPTAHYSMGGIPSDVNGQVSYKDQDDKPVVGFFAAGECSCVSVHGANRLGTNSLLEAVVFGRRTGRAIREQVRDLEPASVTDADAETARAEVDRFMSADGNEKVGAIRSQLRDLMTEKCGVFRTGGQLTEARNELKDLQGRFGKISIDDHTQTFNTDLLDAIELGHMLEFSEVIVTGALARQESRGGHARKDHATRDDENWYKHTIAYKDEDGPRLAYSEVNMQPEYRDPYPPEERKY
jgi:succinate dehydrogenase / fumarate reductase flavoprotein subunit